MSSRSSARAPLAIGSLRHHCISVGTRTAALLLVLGWVSPLVGQSAGNSPIILELPASTRALGLGTAFVLDGRDPDAIFYNPGALSSARGVGIGGQRFGSASTLVTVAGATEWSGGGLAVGVEVLGYRPSTVNVGMIAEREEALLEGGGIGASELVGTVGYGRDIGGWGAGIALKLIEQRVGGAQDGTFAADLGITKAVGRLTLGVAAQHLGPGLTTSGSDLPLPHRLTVGASVRSWQLGPLDVVNTGSVARRRDGEIIPAAGVELSWWPIVGRTFVGRVGVRRVPEGGAYPVSFGIAFIGDEITIEYAFQGFDEPGDAHRIGFRWR